MRRLLVAFTACALLWSGFAQTAFAATVDTSITGSPASPTNQTAASFSFNASQGGASFTCKLDAGVAAACTSPKAYTGLTAGSHTFSVYATRQGVPDPTPATATWTIDLTTPNVPGGATATALSSTSVRVNWNAATDNIALAGYDVFRDGGLLTSVGAVTTFTDNAVGAGTTHTYTVRSRDTAGNVSAQSAGATVTTPPDTTITGSPSSPTNQTTASIAFTSTPAGASFTCRLDAGAVTACTSPVSFSGLTAGTHAVQVTAAVNGVPDPTPATVAWSVDLTVPTVPGGVTGTALSPTSVRVNWTAATDNFAIAGYDLFRDGVLLTTLGAVTTATDTTVTGGSTHTYAVRSRDTAGNVSALSAAVPVTTPPDTSITTAPASPTNQTTVTIPFAASVGGATFTCRLDTGVAAACTSPKVYAGLTGGSHTFSVFSTVNGVSDPSPATASWTVDVSLPSVPGGLTGTATSPTSVRLNWAASTDNLAVAGYDVVRDGVPLTSLGTVTTYTDTTVAAGSTHTYALRSRDTAGNVSALTAAVPVTTPIPPDTLLDVAPSAFAASTAPSFSFHATYQGTTVTTATFSCKLDTGFAGACTSPKAYTGLTQGTHTFTVTATYNGVADTTPATWTWVVDTVVPTTPTGVVGTSPASGTAALSWVPSTDAGGLASYDIFRNGALLTTVAAPASGFTDTGLTGGSTYTYAVRARDRAGNLSATTAAVSVTLTLPYDAHLTRAPYLTDLVAQHTLVNFATDRSSAVATVRYGAVANGTCTLTDTVNATRVTVSVNGTFEYQWKASLDLPAAGTYCYRPYLGAADLLGANPAPRFTTQVAVGSSENFTFAVFGDWGQVDADGNNQDAANLMTQIAQSGARFAITTGDNGYPAGSQGNYGDLQQKGPDTSGIFAQAIWGKVGQSLPLFPAIGNHGLARSDAIHPHFSNWPQDLAVSSSNGRYTTDTYCCPNGSASADYPSPWYAFSAGNSRFYVLDVAWADLNAGTGTPYGNEYLSHWTPTSPQYQWLQADLAAHPSGLKFAFFHYPIYSDQPSENGDSFLQGNSSLEGLLSNYGVNLGFSGHAHIYQRSAAATGPGRKSLITYVTGGGGGQAQSTGSCANNDRYAIGWSFTNGAGTSCGTAPAPSSPAAVYHYLKVSVSGSTVTVTPTDSLGRTFDVQTYTFAPKPDTFIDSAPPVGTTSTSATFAFHASGAGATYSCKLDTGLAAACTSPKLYTGLAQGTHTFTVTATIGGVADPLPATWTWKVDTTPPGAPAGLTASAPTPFATDLTWTAGTDNLGIAGYDVFRDGVLLAGTTGTATTFTDTAVSPDTSYTYTVRTRDAAGSVSAFTAPAVVRTPPAPVPVFVDGFESGGLGAWTASAGLTVGTGNVRTGTRAAEGDTLDGNTYAKVNLPGTYADAFARVGFDAVEQSSPINLLRLRDSTGGSIGYLYLANSGALGFHNDATGTNTISATMPATGWHALELHLGINGTSSVVDVWLDGARIADLSGTVDLGTAPVGQFQIGEVQAGRIYDVLFDDAAFGTARLGPQADAAPPTVPANVTATATSAFSVDVAWAASTDNVLVSGYDVLRDGAIIGSVDGSTTTYSDGTVSAVTGYSYTVRARDLSGNLSAESTPAPVITPIAANPVFADGFETGDLTGWTATSGLTVENTDVRTGLFAADASTTNGNTYARKVLPATYPDAYARVAFEVLSQSSQLNLLRLRDATGNSIGYVYLTNGGRIGLHNDTTGVNSTSSTIVGPGWHVLELHAAVNGAAGLAQVWLDGTLVPVVSGPADLGSAPVGVLQIGETQTGQTYDIAYDDAAFGTTRLGAAVEAVPPSVPADLTATASSAFAVDLTWTASADNLGVSAYDVQRDGTTIGTVTGTTFTDADALAGTTYSYRVRARDYSGNPSDWTVPVGVTTPHSPIPVFADGFESGDLRGWTIGSGLTVETGSVRTGNYAAEGDTTTGNVFVKKTLGGTFADAYARLGFRVAAQSGQVNLLRLRDAAGNSLGYVYQSAAGRLGFHNDTTNTNTLSATVVAPGWHALELHLGINGPGSVVEVWLDGARVADLSATTDLGTTPVGVLQVGETQAGQTYDVLYDDAAFGSARLGPFTDALPPTTPTNLSAAASSAFAVDLAWDAASDDVGIGGYEVLRDGVSVGTTGPAVTTFSDTSVLGSSTYSYQVRALDVSGNLSAPSVAAPITTPAPVPPLFADGFEGGNLKAWTSSGGLVVESTDTRTGAYAAEGDTVNGNTYAKKTLPGTYADAYARLGFEVKSQAAQLNLLRLRDAAGVSIGYLYLTPAGLLAFHNDTTNTNTVSGTTPAAGWHALELHLGVNGASSTVEAWLDGARVSGLTLTTDLGVAPVGQLQIGETQTARTYDVVLDDAAFSTARIGPVADAVPPTAPTNVTATATSAFSVQVDWTAATDNLAVSGYEIARDGETVGITGPNATTFSDPTVFDRSTYSYTVLARDGSGNVSPWSDPATVTTPPPPPPLFADGFESGTTSAWTTSTGLAVQGSDVRTGAHAADATTTNGGTFAKKTLTSTYLDAYARLGFEVRSQSGQVNVLRLRSATDASIGYVYVTAGGFLGFHSDATNVNTTSTTVVGPGWHALELHAGIAGPDGVVQVWLDGVAVPTLSGPANVGITPVGVLQIGETQTGQTYDLAYDDAAFGTARLGPNGDATPPTVPAEVATSTPTAFSVRIDWTASTDDMGVAGYDIVRDGNLLATVDASSSSYVDSTVLDETTHAYSVRARDIAGNVSDFSPTVSATTPVAPQPDFGDGFETGDLSAWTTSGGLGIEWTDVRAGQFSAEAATTDGGAFAKRTLTSTYTDAYTRLGFEVVSQAGQVNLLRLRDAAGGSIGYLYVTASGNLGFHDDATNVNTTSSVAPGAGWHGVELHVVVDGTSSTVEVWLDGVRVPDLSMTTDLGTAPVGVLQIGETQTGQTYTVRYDNAAIGTARLGPTGDVVAPTAPEPVAVSTPTPFSAQVSWPAATDNIAVSSYDVLRDGAVIATTTAATTGYTDGTLLPSTGYSYTVRARDAANNASVPSTAVAVTTPPPPPPVFADGFETGDLSAWTSSAGLTLQGTVVRNGATAAQGNTTNGNVVARRTLGATYADAYARLAYNIRSQTSQVNLLRLRDAAGNSIGYLFVTPTGFLGFHDDTGNLNTSSTVVPGAGWHALELHFAVNGASSLVEVWLDGALVPGLSGPVNLGTAPVGQIQIGETQTGQTYDVVYDDAAFGTSRLGPVGDGTAPAAPGAPTVTATTPFSTQVDWADPGDDTGVTSYDVYRDGLLVTSLPAATRTYTDLTVLATSSHSYAVRARDAANNVSAVGTATNVTLPAALASVFADGFESGNLTAWTSSGGLVVQTGDVRSGGFAAEGNTTNGNTFAKKTLPGSYTDAYARVGYKLKSGTAQVNLLRMRDAAGNSLGYTYLTTAGQLAFHNDALNTNTISSVLPGAGWHSIEMHLVVNGPASTVEIWLDGVKVSALSQTNVNLGAVPVGAFQIGETQTARTYDVLLDDAAFSTTRLGL